jgi:hypothetical protein
MAGVEGQLKVAGLDPAIQCSDRIPCCASRVLDRRMIELIEARVAELRRGNAGESQQCDRGDKAETTHQSRVCSKYRQGGPSNELFIGSSFEASLMRRRCIQPAVGRLYPAVKTAVLNRTPPSIETSQQEGIQPIGTERAAPRKSRDARPADQ